MPELPEVESVRRMLAAQIKGKRIFKSKILLPRILKSGSLAELHNSTILGIHRRGKYLQINTNTPLSIFFHLGMTGSLLWDADSTGMDNYIRAWLELDDGRVLFRDIRTFGKIWIRAENDPPWSNIGYEPFDPSLTADVIILRLQKRSMNIKTVLLDQKLIAGIGNIYASEVLYDTNINPCKPAKEITEDELTRIINSIRVIFKASINSSGTTFRDFRLSNGKEGGFANFLKVYGKENDPCPKCSTNIQRIVLSQRSTFFCPICQRN